MVCAVERTSNSAARPTDSANTSIARKKKTLMARMETRITLSGCRRPTFSTRTENNLPLPINHTPCCWLYRPQAKSSGVAIDRPSSFLSIIPTLIIRGVAASRLPCYFLFRRQKMSRLCLKCGAVEQYIYTIQSFDCRTETMEVGSVQHAHRGRSQSL